LIFSQPKKTKKDENMSSLSTQRRLHDGLLVDLKCPLTLDFFVDPITVPCCGKSFEREELVEHLRNNLTCPCCNGDLSRYDAQNQAKNVVLAALVETLQQLQAGGAEATPRATTPKEHAWSCTATPIVASSTMCELVLNLQNARFQTRPALFIAVLDRSGSMSGAPHAQVLAALKHIESLAAHNAHVRLVMLTYGDDCKEITKAADYIIAGGTNFRAAFAMVNTVLQRYICSDDPADAERANNVSMATVVLMTDGQDCSGNRQTLVPEFKEMLVARWGDKPLAVHTVGFSGGCDRELLESIRTAGTVEGLYRYAEPGDDADALCQKLSGIFELSSNASTVPIRFHLLGSAEPIEHAVRLEVNAVKHGSYRCWLDLVPGSQLTLSLSSAIDNDLRVPIRVLAPSEFVMQRWLTHLVDSLATEVLDLSKRSIAVDGKPMTHNVRTLCCALLQKKIFAIRPKLADEHVRARLDYIAQQIEQLQCGQAINVGKLSDLRFASLFAAPEPSGKSAGVALVSTQTLHTAPKQVDDKPFFERHMRCYSRNNVGKNRNPLQSAIMHQLTDRTSADVSRLLAEATLADVLHVDCDGNNTLMLAAYCGHERTVRFLLDKYGPKGTGDLDVAALARENLHGESAMTMAIKKRGYHFTIGALLDVGVQITRPKSLERYAIEQKYLITAQIIARIAEQQAAGAGESIAIKIDASAKPEFVQYMFERALASGGTAQWEPQQFLDVALGKQMTSLAKRLIVECGTKPTLAMLLDHCIPKKPDAPDTPLYIELAQLALDADPTLIAGKTSDDDDNETPLHRAVQRGSLPHVQLFATKFAERGISIDEPTAKGNSALWVAAFQCYPCIIDDLLDRGADVNRSNAKGNASLYGPCTRGNRKVAAQLIAAGACIEKINSNGDTLVLICCRNGHHEVLELLLTYVDETFVNRKAHIDGFNAIMACAEQDRADCIRVLHEYGIALDQQTDDDNQILKRASPLHIAAYYGRLAALGALLQCGANPNIADLNGQTPLHIAVVQGNVDAIRLLRSKGADCAIADLSGNVPMAYTRDRKDVRKALIDPVLDVLMLLARGGFAKEEEALKRARFWSSTLALLAACRRQKLSTCAISTARRRSFRQYCMAASQSPRVCCLYALTRFCAMRTA
jgi:ankyrin repeat protein